MKLHKIISGYTKVSNDVLNNPNLSLKAKGLYAYLCSKPDDYEFSLFRIMEDSEDGRESTQTAIHELENSKFLVRKKNPDGTTDYILGTQPIDESQVRETRTSNPSTGNPYKVAKYGKTQVRETRTISKTDYETKTDKKERQEERQDKTDPSASGAEVAEIIKLFESVNAQAKDWFKNTTQRKAVNDLVENYGFEQVTKVVKALPKMIAQPYCPKITSPFELRRDYSKLMAWGLQHKAKQSEGGRKIIGL